jgi:4-hydroxy-tetrahydrodipicolinate synthase
MTLYVPMITPFDERGAVALDALEKLAGEVLDGGATGLVALGTTGEPAALDEAEKRAVVDRLAAVCAARSVPLVVGANSVAAVRALSPEVAAAALSVVPPFVRPGEEGVVAYFAELAAASPVPIIVYHVPYRTAQPLSVATLRRLAALPGVTGVKLATGGIDASTMELLADPPPEFHVLGGDDVVVSPLLAMGAAGAILASAHVDTAAFAALIEAWRSGDAGAARTLGHRLSGLSAALFAEPNPTVIKGVLHELGRIPTPAVRLPLLPASGSSVRTALSRRSPRNCG